jgi:hypothetical protein
MGLEVAQPAVDELRAPAARPVREIAPLEQGHRQPARSRVEGHAGARHAAADHHHVDGLAAGQHVMSARRSAA